MAGKPCKTFLRNIPIWLLLWKPQVKVGSNRLLPEAGSYNVIDALITPSSGGAKLKPARTNISFML